MTPRPEPATRRLRASDKFPGRDIVAILVQAGCYERAEPLVFAPKDAGTAESRTVFAAPPGDEGRAVLSGNRITLDHNLYWNPAGEPNFSGGGLAAWQARGFDAHSIVADPRFVDADKDDFRLKADTPALQLGFRPLDLSAVGLRDQAARRGEKCRPSGPIPRNRSEACKARSTASTSTRSARRGETSDLQASGLAAGEIQHTAAEWSEDRI